MNVYFAHSSHLYNTNAERFIIDQMLKYFPDWNIINPKDIKHVNSDKQSKIVDCIKVILDDIDQVVFITNGGYFGQGVYQ